MGTWGRNGSVTLFVSDMERPPRFQDGMPRPFPVAVFANPTFAFNVNLPNPRPSDTMTADFSGGGKARGINCPLAQFDGCDELDFPAAGRYIVLLTLKFDDGSALCDNITVRVAECSGAARVEVIPKPKRPIYDPASPSQRDIDLTVRLVNTSQPRGGLPACPFLLRGGNVLSCSAALKVGGVTDTKATTFDLPHCSATTSQGCQSDADCACPQCQRNEVCLTKPHCSDNFTRECGSDLDCQPPACVEPECKADETCVRILRVGVSDIIVPPGQSVELFHQPLTLTNVLADTARLADTWTANVLIPPLTANGTIKYRIRGRPSVAP